MVPGSHSLIRIRQPASQPDLPTTHCHAICMGFGLASQSVCCCGATVMAFMCQVKAPEHDHVQDPTGRVPSEFCPIAVSPRPPLPVMTQASFAVLYSRHRRLLYSPGCWKTGNEASSRPSRRRNVPFAAFGWPAQSSLQNVVGSPETTIWSTPASCAVAAAAFLLISTSFAAFSAISASAAWVSVRNTVDTTCMCSQIVLTLFQHFQVWLPSGRI